MISSLQTKKFRNHYGTTILMSIKRLIIYEVCTSRILARFALHSSKFPGKQKPKQTKQKSAPKPKAESRFDKAAAAANERHDHGKLLNVLLFVWCLLFDCGSFHVSSSGKLAMGLHLFSLDNYSLSR